MQTIAARNETKRGGSACADNGKNNVNHSAKVAQNRPNLSINTNVALPKKKGWNYFFPASSSRDKPSSANTSKPASTASSNTPVIKPRTTSLAAVVTTQVKNPPSPENLKALSKRNNSLPIITGQQDQPPSSANNVNVSKQPTTYPSNNNISSTNILHTQHNNHCAATAPPRPFYKRQFSHHNVTPASATLYTSDTSSSLHTVETPSTATNHSISSAIMKKFHFPFFFHKRQNSFASEDQRAAFFKDLYTPPAPEPLIPSMYDCMSPTDSPVSPLPWELTDLERLNRRKHHSFGHQFESSMSPSLFNDMEDEDSHLQRQSRSVRNSYFSDSDFDKMNQNSNSACSSPVTGVALAKASATPNATELNRASSITLHDSANGSGSNNLRRRSSCPNYDAISMTSSASSTTSSTRTLVDNDIVSITEKHTRDAPFLKKSQAATATAGSCSHHMASSSASTPMAKSSSNSSCCKKLANKLSRDNSTSSIDTTPASANVDAQHQLHHSSSSTSLCDSDQLKYLYIPTVFDPLTRSPVLQFATIKPRKYQMHRKVSWKKEAKALMTWHHSLEDKLRNAPPPPSLSDNLPPEKLEKSLLTRRFILREFFTTEVNFWNQLYHTKLVFYDALVFTLQKEYTLLKEEDMDMFANLFDLMQFSAKLINHLRHFQLRNQPQQSMNSPNSLKAEDGTTKTCRKDQAHQQEDHLSMYGEECLDENNLYLGRSFLDMAEDLVVFLRCAIDYKTNRKILDRVRNNELAAKYRQTLMLRKETRRFAMDDYLIIPIQRVGRYGLLLTDLLKHTQKSHPDYDNLVKCLHIVTSLGYAMDSVQKKKKKT